MDRGRAACLLLLPLLHVALSRPRQLVTSDNTAGVMKAKNRVPALQGLLQRLGEPHDTLDIFTQIVDSNKGSTQPMKQGDIAINNGHSALQCDAAACYWPKSSSGAVHVPYSISPSYTGRHQALIREALEDFNTLTCIKLVNRTTETDYLSITSGNGCWSHIGKIGGGQTVSLAESGCMSKGIIQHEVDHSLGFFHEHVRSDRDEYVDVQLQNIAEGEWDNFKKQETNNLDLPYDFQSVLHYGRYTFSKTPGQPSIIPKPDPNIEIGQRYGLSPLDVAKLNKLYSCDLCSTLLTSANGSLASANHPENYANNASCLWLIRLQRNKVALQFNAFDLQTSLDCTSDYVTVYDGASRASPVLLHKACGSAPLPLLVASGGAMLVEFVSDGAVTRSGFSASYDSVKCGGSFTRDNGVVTTPGFPEAYPNSMVCVWSIQAPVGHQIQLEFSSFDVERFPECDCDYLAVKDGGTTKSPLLGKYCGNAPLQPIASTGNMLLLQFHSDVWVNKPGFSIAYSFKFTKFRKSTNPRHAFIGPDCHAPAGHSTIGGCGDAFRLIGPGPREGEEARDRARPVRGLGGAREPPSSSISPRGGLASIRRPLEAYRRSGALPSSQESPPGLSEEPKREGIPGEEGGRPRGGPEFAAPLGNTVLGPLALISLQRVSPELGQGPASPI